MLECCHDHDHDHPGQHQLCIQELYRNAYNLVLHKYGELLYNGVQADPGRD